MQGLLLVTSTQFGQSALDGLPGAHSPFATALFAALEANSGVYFEQVFNEVARATYEAAQKQGGFPQIPGKVVGGAAPADCLAGKDCVGDARMAALAVENERLTKDAAGVRNILEGEEAARGKPYTAEERQKRVAELEATLARIGTSTDPLRQEARRLIDGGNMAAGQAKLDQALDADEKAIAEAERVAAERRTAAARNARDLAVLARGTDIAKAVAYYQRATRLDSSDPQTWFDYANAASDAGRTAEAESAFSKAMLLASEANNTRVRFWATVRLGDVAVTRGKLSNARQLYETATGILEPFAKGGDIVALSDLVNLRYRIGDALRAQGDLSSALDSYRGSLAISERIVAWHPYDASQSHLVVANERIGDVLVDQGKLAAALESFRAALAINEQLAKADSGNARWQRGLSVSHNKIGDVLLSEGDMASALESYRTSLLISERLTKADPGNAEWQRDLSVSHNKVGNVLQKQGNLAAALDSYRTGLAIIERLTKFDPGNAGWQVDLGFSNGVIGDILMFQAFGLTSERNEALSLAHIVHHMRRCSRTLGLCNLDAALKHYRVKNEIIARLAASDPGNAAWKRELALSHSTIGDALQAQGNLATALDSYRAALAIDEDLATVDPVNVAWQADLALSHGRIAMVLAAQGQPEHALRVLRQGREILAKLKEMAPNSVAMQETLSVFDGAIAELEQPNGRQESARPTEGERSNAQSRSASDGSPPADKKVVHKAPRKTPLSWQQELWRR